MRLLSTFGPITGSLIAFGAIVGCGVPAKANVAKKEKETKPAAPVASVSDPGQLDKETLDRVKGATVLIGNFEGGKLSSMGSGFVVDDGQTILTSKHVVTGSDDDADPCKIVFFSGTSKSKMIKVDPDAYRFFDQAKRKDEKYYELDVAAIRIDAKVTEPLKLGSTVDLTESTSAWAFGFPHGAATRTLEKDLPSCTVHSMRIERIQRKESKTKILQLSGSPTSGDSGGPVVLRDATVIGVIQAKDNTTSSVFAVPESPMLEIVGRAKKNSVTVSSFAQPLSDSKFFSREPKATGGSRGSGRPIVSGRSTLADQRLDASDVEGVSARTLTVLRNEPFARRGYIFKRPELRKIFEGFAWYYPRTRDMEAVRRTFNGNERYNVDFIKRYQTANSLDW